MANEETEMNFVRCWNCRSLVPSTATRCRMCGSSLTDNQAATGGNQEPPPEEAGERRSRIRQKTMSISEAAVQSIKASVAAQSTASEPPMSTPSLGSQVSTSGFRLGGRPGSGPAGEAAGRELSAPPPPRPIREPISPSLSVTARALRELDEEAVEEPFTPLNPQSIASQSMASQSVAPESDADAPSFEVELDVAPDLEADSREEVGAEVGVESDEQLLIEEDFDDDGEEDTEGEVEGLELSVDQPTKKRKRRRRKKKKAGQVPGMGVPGVSGPSVNAASGNVAGGSGTMADRASQFDRASQLDRAPQVDRAPRAESANTSKQPENQTMHHSSRPSAQASTQASFQNDTHHEPTRGGNGQPAARHSAPPVDSNRKRVECPQGGLIGWFINYDKDKGGVATEIRCGRFFICGEKLKDTDLVLEHATLSTPHCLVKAGSQEGLKIQDLMSEHGTFIKRRGEAEFRRQHETATVYHGDMLKFGDYEVMVCLIDFPYAD